MYYFNCILDDDGIVHFFLYVAQSSKIVPVVEELPVQSTELLAINKVGPLSFRCDRFIALFICLRLPNNNNIKNCKFILQIQRIVLAPNYQNYSMRTTEPKQEIHIIKNLKCKRYLFKFS